MVHAVLEQKQREAALAREKAALQPHPPAVATAAVKRTYAETRDDDGFIVRHTFIDYSDPHTTAIKAGLRRARSAGNSPSIFFAQLTSIHFSGLSFISVVIFLQS